jgi:hypothetical protein
VSWEYIAGFALLWIASFAASIVAITVLLVNLPATYFLSTHRRQLWIDRHRVIRWSGVVLKNLLGLCLVLLGGVLSVPGVPGQGLVTVVIGLVLLDFPGKRRLEQQILSRPRLYVRINRLRARFGREPLMLDDHEG